MFILLNWLIFSKLALICQKQVPSGLGEIAGLQSVSAQSCNMLDRPCIVYLDGAVFKQVNFGCV